MAAAYENVLEVNGLTVRFAARGGTFAVVRDLSFVLRRGETLALVGESGSGKSVTSMGLMRLMPAPPQCLVSGSIRLRRRDGTTEELTTLPDAAMNRLRGNEMAMIFQEPMTSLNPVHTIGDQVAEVLITHQKLSRPAALNRAAELLDLVGISEPRRRLGAYPHHLSGGMRQRVMIAMALACEPQLLIADEPTTALDVTVQAQILDLIRKLQRQMGMAVLFITHNLAVVAEIADRVMVMYCGQMVEQGSTMAIFTQPRMPYTRGLLRSVPRLESALLPDARLTAIPGNVADPREAMPGCGFLPRCAQADPRLCATVPQLESIDNDHDVRCLRWRDLPQMDIDR